MDREQLLKGRLQEHEYDIPDVGTVRFRALSRQECLKFQGKKMSVEDMEVQILVLSMVDPKMSEEDVREWQRASPVGELQALTTEIARASGMEPRFRDSEGSVPGAGD